MHINKFISPKSKFNVPFESLQNLVIPAFNDFELTFYLAFLNLCRMSFLSACDPTKASWSQGQPSSH